MFVDQIVVEVVYSPVIGCFHSVFDMGGCHRIPFICSYRNLLAFWSSGSVLSASSYQCGKSPNVADVWGPGGLEMSWMNKTKDGR